PRPPGGPCSPRPASAASAGPPTPRSTACSRPVRSEPLRPGPPGAAQLRHLEQPSRLGVAVVVDARDLGHAEVVAGPADPLRPVARRDLHPPPAPDVPPRP